MRIALDYDDTYTIDPNFWHRFRNIASFHGHQVFIVTKRGEDNKGFLSIDGWTVHHTNRMAKGEWCKLHNIHVDVWIDDAPRNILEGG